MDLNLTLADVSQDYVLVQAFKKTCSYLRYHSWFADTIEMDRASADLPRFLESLSAEISAGEWVPSSLQLVMAPKSQSWGWNDKKERWGPLEQGHLPLRPLAHVALRDQVVATAIMLCLANRVETHQGDPRLDFAKGAVRRTVSSYGNRLFCDREAEGDTLRHRWASQSLYRAYFQDYRTFVSRADWVAAREAEKGRRAFITQSDLSQFYDRVRPASLQSALRGLSRDGDDPAFFDLCERVFDWHWHGADEKAALEYAKRNAITGFDQIALPQGLVAAGFLANIVLFPLDAAMRDAIRTEVAPNLELLDFSRYVDDLRLVLASDATSDEETASLVGDWLNALVTREVPFLRLSADKTQTARFGGDESHLVRVSRKMDRIQRGISGGFDADGGEDLIQSIEALVKSQSSISAQRQRSQHEPFAVVPDVKSDTVNRFAAGRFRAAYRSLRPLLPEAQDFAGLDSRQAARLTRSDLDGDAHSFALDLINAWKDNPANVRLLRIGLDLWPSRQVLEPVLSLIRPYLDGTVTERDPIKVVAYCLSEVFRAAATETGFVADAEAAPSLVNVEAYRTTLLEFAQSVVLPGSAPWYVKQQALLFLAAFRPRITETTKFARPSLRSHDQIVNFLAGEDASRSAADFAILAIIAHRSFPSHRSAVANLRSITEERFAEIAKRDIEFAREIYQTFSQNVPINKATSIDLDVDDQTTTESPTRTLRAIVKADKSLNSLRNEIGILSFAKAFAERIKAEPTWSTLTPSSVIVQMSSVGNYSKVDAVNFIQAPEPKGYKSIYTTPEWASNDTEWRLRLGYLIRYILTSRLDFSFSVTTPSWKNKKEIYQPTKGHWLLRQYGFYNGHEAFGDDWVAISQYTQSMLFRLLRWPGCRVLEADYDIIGIDGFISEVTAKLDEALNDVGSATSMLFLKVDAPNPTLKAAGRPLRGCVVQSVLPSDDSYATYGPELNDPVVRLRQRNHLTTALAAVQKMLDLRETHASADGRLDWLIFPELAVHPEDVDRYLKPFARAYKTIILAGLSYQRLVASQPLVNSAIWIVPIIVPGQGLQVIVRRQGKEHLASLERQFGSVLHGFRPCQWLIGYQWTTDADADPLWLTASVCYDATDLGLASDLRNKSDVYAIPALNRDVGTFDSMAHALHYHMFQPVLVANNGTYGGSNKYTPKGAVFQRQVFHTHGQPQATISFFEIPDISDLKSRVSKGHANADQWKFPPAGM